MTGTTILHEAIENHIRGLDWADERSDETKTVVAGNIRYAFEALHVHEILDALTDQMDPVTRCVESCPIGRLGQHSVACTAARIVVAKLELKGAPE